MPSVPLPASPCVRVRLIYNTFADENAGNRFFLSYSGSAPTGANCATLASDIVTAFNTDLNPLLWDEYGLAEVDVLDIATDSGLSGQATSSAVGGRSGSALPIQCAMNVEYGIGRRYRGGKPRAYFPFGVDGDLESAFEWTSAFTSAAQSGVAAFFAAVEALSVGSMGTLNHVNLSYYKGFENFTQPSGRERAVPTYRATALVDNVTGYFAKQKFGSQRRRRSSTTP